MLRLPIVLLVVLAAACSAPSTSPDAGSPEPDGGAARPDAGEAELPDAGEKPDAGVPPQGRRVVVTWIDTWVHSGTEEQLPGDLSNLMAFSLEDAGLVGLPIHPVDAGVGAIQPAPEGELYFRKRMSSERYWIDGDSVTWRVSEADHEDFGERVMGRPNAERGDAGTTLEITWIHYDGGTAVLSAPEVGIGYRYVGAPEEQGSNVSGHSFVGAPLPKAGDDVWLFGYADRESLAEDGGVQSQYLVTRSFTSDAVDLQHGQTTPLTVSLNPVSSATFHPLDVRKEEFAAEAQRVRPGATYYSTDIRVSAAPDPDALFVPVELAGTGDLYSPMPDVLEVPDPFGGAWTRTALVYVVTTAGAFYTRGDIELLSQPIRPTLGMPEQLLIDGKDPAQSPVVSRSPTLTWTAPALGQPTRYHVKLSRSGTTVAWFHTTRTELRIPPDLLEPQTAYTAWVRAYRASAPGVPSATSQLRTFGFTTQ